ncbi:hypothetical protein [Chitinophaga nivalis]|uniref:DUF4136 domain-containing protein n=1 Tax=Chitinophaga nivalis TaxID=2991709 RepID=A0ABT3IV77_9BACT|nr:hypothetical protein [Chitinophaga nivalis]MCW3462450.1 hypothetical protein [Chitinophaga nivalis]MCW3487859.1 hypothetical protein [Chitinophaga nivalis]
MKKLGLIMAGVVIMALGACSSTKVTSSWRANDAKQLQKENKIMVMALVPEKDRSLRSQMESYTVAALKKKGYNAVSALQEYGPQQLGKMSEKQVLRKLQGSDVNQVMTIVMLDKGKEKSYVPGSMYQPYGYYGFWPYYSRWYSRMYDPGYYTYNTKYQWEGNLYDLNSGQLLYSVQSQSFDPPTTERMAVLYAQQVVKDMYKHQLLASN